MRRIHVFAVAVGMIVCWGGSRVEAQTLTPTNVVSNVYHSTPAGDNNRGSAFADVTDGDTRANGAEGFDTFAGAPENTLDTTDFAGLIYTGPTAQPIVFNTVTFHVGNQFGDGGSFAATPNLYLLVNNVDPNTAKPETNANYVLLVNGQSPGGALTSPATPGFDEPPTPGPGGGNTPPEADESPIVFNLTALPASQRTGFGFAVGGVSGDGQQHFLSISELSATGVVPEPASLSVLGFGILGLLARRRR